VGKPWILFLGVLLFACREPAPESGAAEPAAEALPIRTDPSPVVESTSSLALRLPAPGTPRDAVLADSEGCAAQLEPSGERCRFHGHLSPLPAPCEGGCTWWTYRFDGDRLAVAELERANFDVDESFAHTFWAEAREVAGALTRSLGVSESVVTLNAWSAVEEAPDGARVVLERRIWETADQFTTYTLSGRAGHHPGVELHVRVEPLRPATLEVDVLDPGLTTGAPLLHLRGGPLPRPIDVPLWLTFDERDRGQLGRCSMHHEAVAFPLADGRIYVGQYNSWCGGPRTCRVLDVASLEEEVPAGGCVWGEGIHHRVVPIDGPYLLLSSSSEGGGHVDIVSYDTSLGTAVELHLPFGSAEILTTEVRDAGVDISTSRELSEHVGPTASPNPSPLHRYRWTEAGGLAAL